MQNGDFYFGRNLDLHQDFGSRVVITPRRFQLAFRKLPPLNEHYAFLGIATVKKDYPLYAEAANEKGLCAAGLNFPDNAYYAKTEERGKQNVSPFELIPFLLGRCATLAEAKALLETTRLVAIPFDKDTPLTPLHWHIADKTGSIAVEQTESGLRIYDDPVGVLTNNPPFESQLQELCRYAHLTTHTSSETNGFGLKPFSLALGSFGLCGDYSSPSRFVKAAWLLKHTPDLPTETERVAHFFHLLSAVAPPKGSVLTAKNEVHYALYSCCVNASKGVYYYRTYDGLNTEAIALRRENSDGERLSVFPLTENAPSA